ncbi:hypothetical protein [Massilia sp. TSP1-1-2]|uniref:hypothetical protein n=1 Tax=Massilia sp. TSP1-1-2 TaxID=2804649 RepID=UPI003CFA4AA4
MKAIYPVLAVGALAVLLATLRAPKAPPAPIDGYLNGRHVVFPAERYTFLATTRMVAGRRFITDNLWGFRYPSMAPMLPRERADFLRAYAHTDWIKVAVLGYTPAVDADLATRAARTCMNYTIAHADQPGHAMLLTDKDVFERDPQRHFGGLHRFNAPSRPPYNDARTYGGPVSMYWDDSSGAACTLIQCSAYARQLKGQHCDHTYQDRVRHLEFSMDYDSALLPHWRDIQNQTVAIFDSFR